MYLLKALKKIFGKKEEERVNFSAKYAERQFRELARKNLSIPVKLYHL